MNKPSLPPKELEITQTWFGTCLHTPLEDCSRLANNERGQTIAKEAPLYIKPSPTLEPHQRIEIYCQQYWWRLLNIMQETYPLLTRLFGYHDFNCLIAEGYLSTYIPNDWSFQKVTNHLPEYLEKTYAGEDKAFILNVAQLDNAFDQLFVAYKKPSLKTLSGPALEKALKGKLTLQPALRLFHFPYNLFFFREELLKLSVEQCEKEAFPHLETEDIYTALFQDEQGHLSWRGLSLAEFTLLSAFKKPHTIEELSRLILTLGPEVQEEAPRHLADWFQRWTFHEWLVPA